MGIRGRYRWALLAAVPFLASCGVGDDADRAAPPTATTTTTASVSTTTTAGEAEPEALLVGISIHVEGFDDRDPAQYARHLAAVQQVAAEADAAGITLTFELNRSFVDAALIAGDGWVASLRDHGQAVGVHADLGGRPLPPRQFTQRLIEHKRDVEALLGAPVTHVSGVCSEQQWIEPVIEAGFSVATGMVEFCLKSLDTIPAEYDVARIDACTTPADCHGQAPTDVEHKLHPWRTSTSADWLTQDPTGDLWLVAGESGRNVACLAETSEGGCQAASDDVVAFAEIVRDYVDRRVPGRRNTLALSWSIGSVPPDGFVTDLAGSVAGLPIEWRSVADLTG